MNKFEEFSKGLDAAYKNLEAWAETIDWEKVYRVSQYVLNDLPIDLERESVRLMDRGWFVWFLDGHMNDVAEKAANLVNKSEFDQDSYMTNYAKENLKYFKSQLVSAYPNRSKQIEDAFACHNSGLYFSSIPTFLALSEGVGRDLYPGIGLFAKRNSIPVTDSLFSSISALEVFEEAVLKPLRVSSDVTRTIINPTTAEKSLFNRHLIMHGNSDNYGTEVNSLKAICLSYFVHKSLNHLKDAENT